MRLSKTPSIADPETDSSVDMIHVDSKFVLHGERTPTKTKRKLPPVFTNMIKMLTKRKIESSQASHSQEIRVDLHQMKPE